MRLGASIPVFGNNNSAVSDKITFPAGLSLVDQNLTFLQDWTWKIALNSYTNPADVVRNIPYTSSGYHRLDIFVCTTANTFLRIAGPIRPINQSTVAPVTPSNTIYVTFVTVTENTISEPSMPMHVHPIEDVVDLKDTLDSLANDKQNVLVSGTNIKTLAGQSLLGAGNLPMPSHTHAIADVTGLQAALDGKQATLVSGTNIKTFNNQSVLGSGNISLPVMPPPFLDNLIPDSNLPSTTGNFVLLGSFFTPAMCDRVNNPNGIIFEGQTINYATFISDNEIQVNITTGAAEGTFDITLNNGVSIVFSDALLIVLGDVFSPVDANWIDKTTVDTTDDGTVKIVAQDVIGTATLDPAFWTFGVGVGKRLTFKFKESPFELSPLNAGTTYGVAINRLDGTQVYKLTTYGINKSTDTFRLGIIDSITPATNNGFEQTTYNIGMARTYTFERTAAGLFTLKRDGVLIWTPTFQETLELKVKINVKELDIINIKCIDLT